MASNNDFKVILEAMIDNSSLSNIQKQLAKERLKISADISIEDFAKSKQAIEKQIEALGKEIKSILGDSISDKQSSQWAKQYYNQMVSGAKQAAKEQKNLVNAMAKGREQAELARQAEEKRQQAAQSKAINKALEEEYNLRKRNNEEANKIQLSLGVNGDTIAQIEVLRNNFTKLGMSADEVKSKMNGVDTEVKTLKDLMNSGAENSAIVTQFDKLQTVLTQTQNNLKQTRSDYSLLATEQQRLSLANNIEAWNQKNTRATREVREENERYVASLRDLNTQMTKMQFGQIQTGFKQAENSMRTMNRLGLAFKDQWTQAINSFKVWLSASTAVMVLVNKLREMPKTVKELDTALVDLRKTAKMSASELEGFYYTSNDVAKQMGVTTKEILTQAAAWSRLGFNTAESATQMAKLSAQFKMISPGMNLDDATDGLVSVMKAYGIEVNDVLDGIMSKINIIGNNKALNNSDIVEFLTRSSAAMASANNSLEETIALGEAAVEITRDASNAGQVLKTTSMRIRGIDEETETYSEDLEILKGKIADLTKTAKTPGGISLFTDDTKQTYKSTYQILEEISAIWDDLSDKTQADLLEVLAGKRNGQALAAIISNFDSARESMDLMANSAGNADKEIAIAMDSIDYKLNKNKETWVGVSQNLLQRDDMKNVIDAFTAIGEAVDFATDKLGLFGSIGLGAGLFAGFKNVGGLKMQSPIVLNCRQ